MFQYPTDIRRISDAKHPKRASDLRRICVGYLEAGLSNMKCLRGRASDMRRIFARKTGRSPPPFAFSAVANCISWESSLSTFELEAVK